MPSRTAALLGVSANVLFWVSVVTFAALRPDYAHATKAVSELGAWGAPNMWAFNVLGYIVPGLLLATCGWLLGRAAKSNTVAALLALSGMGVAVAGAFPADMNDYRSFTTMGHLVGSTGSLAAWALALVGAMLLARKSWPALAMLSAAVFALTIGAFFLYETLPSGIVQRITFGVFFAYFLAASLMLWRRAA